VLQIRDLDRIIPKWLNMKRNVIPQLTELNGSMPGGRNKAEQPESWTLTAPKGGEELSLEQL